MNNCYYYSFIMLTEINIRYGHQYYGHIKCHNVGPYGLMLYMLMKILLHTIFNITALVYILYSSSYYTHNKFN